MENQVLATESFGQGNKTYFFDLMRSTNGTLYIKMVRTDKQPDDTYTKQQVVFFEENFEFLLQAMRDLFATADQQIAAKRQQIVRIGAAGGIKNWDSEKRPREKLLAGGPEAVSDAELLAILISSGSLRESAVSLAARILASADYSLTRLSAMSVVQFCEFHGMGHAKSLAIVAAMELSRRCREELLLMGRSL